MERFASYEIHTLLKRFSQEYDRPVKWLDEVRFKVIYERDNSQEPDRGERSFIYLAEVSVIA